jgi:O-acetyl-ADP-ribose deacetylase (regulator of RNase III)
MANKSTSVSFGNVRLELVTGNIAFLDADAIVNAANEQLNLGVGVSGAIRESGGSVIQEECNEIGFCATGSAVMTSGGNLKADYVIHAVGPMYGEGMEHAKLSSAVRSALSLAEKKGLNSIAFPALSAGLFHFPLDQCAKIMVSTIKEVAPSLNHLNQVTICLHSDSKFDIFAKALQG